MQRVTAKTLRNFVLSNADASRSTLCSDELGLYRKIGREFKGGHVSVRHGLNEYVRRPDQGARVAVTGHTNTLESFWSHLKRKITGLHHSVSAKHLGLYVAESVYAWNTRKMADGDRLQALVKRTDGRRLVYRRQVA